MFLTVICIFIAGFYIQVRLWKKGRYDHRSGVQWMSFLNGHEISTLLNIEQEFVTNVFLNRRIFTLILISIRNSSFFVTLRDVCERITKVKHWLTRVWYLFNWILTLYCVYMLHKGILWLLLSDVEKMCITSFLITFHIF